MMKEQFETIENLPLLPLRGISIFPGMLVNFDVERPISVAALNAAMSADQRIFLLAQKEISTEMPNEEDLFLVGTICRVKQLLRVPGATTIRVLVEGISRAEFHGLTAFEPCFYGDVLPIPAAEKVGTTPRVEAMIRHCYTLIEEFGKLSGSVKADMLLHIISSDDPGYVADYVAQNIYLRHTQKQVLLEELRPVSRLALLNRFLQREINVLAVEADLQESTQDRMTKNQRDYFLREQMKVIQAELGEGEDTAAELDEYRNKIAALGLTQEVEDKLMKEVSRLSKQPFGSTESSVIRNYLDTCLEVPWNKKTKDTYDISRAKRYLDEDHFGLEKVKDRILEHLAVRQIAPGVKSSVICLVGPPGTGKTSIAMSIARATNRKLARLSLGGVHDEAEIRGHRKTYVGAMPGRIVAGLIQAKSMNPIMVLDEIDKLGSDYRGDPSAALLEALDAEQNGAFRDHFLEIPVDLSDVFFITTANNLDTIPRPLLDRMEVIQLSSYTDEEKLAIAKDHLLPKQRKKHGLKGNQLKISDDALREVISLYTRESGVRVLERNLAALCRKTARGIAQGDFKTLNLRAGSIPNWLGPVKYKPEPPRFADEIGLVHGLAWTAVGGEVLDVEVNIMPGTGKLELTGNLGDVMKESAHIAVSYIRSRADKLGIEQDFYKTKDIHIHFPEGAVPKDGPSAGITMTIALISALTGTPARRDIAMTGEVTLRGRVLAIGGLREKTMAALRNGISTVIIPAANESDLEEIDQTVRAALNFITTDHVDSVLDIALHPIKTAEKLVPVPEDCQSGGQAMPICQ